MTSQIEQIIDDCMDVKKSMGLLCRFEGLGLMSRRQQNRKNELKEKGQLKSVEKRLVINTVLRGWSIPGSIKVTLNVIVSI